MKPSWTLNSTTLSTCRRLAVSVLVAALAAVGTVAVTPSVALAQEELDLYAENAWAIDQIKAESAWSTTKGEGVTVAVVDTGINVHPFFENKDVLDGTSFLSDEDSGWEDVDGHGTGVSATVLYAAPEVTILPVRVISTTANIGFSSGAVQKDFDGIRWAADNGADVIVISWIEVSQLDPKPEFLEAVQYAIDKDVVVVAGGGNDPNLDQVPNPASFPGVVAVSGTDKSGAAWPSSTTGPEIVLAGPADTVTLPKPQVFLSDDSLYFEAAGTSATAGLIGGAAALVRAAHPDLDASNVIQRLITTTDDGGAVRTDELGYGLVNVEAAINADDVEAVTENPLGYPMGEAGASGAAPDDAGTEESDIGEQPTETTQEPKSAATDQAGLDSMVIVLITVAIVLLAGAVVVWLVLRSRSRSKPPVQPWQ